MTDRKTYLERPLEEAREAINGQLEKGRTLRATTIRSENELMQARSQRRKWSDYVEALLERLFTTNDLAREFAGYGTPGLIIAGGYSEPLSVKVDEYREMVDDYLHRLESIEERLELYVSPERRDVITRDAESTPSGNRVFVVHGHDEGAREAVARFIGQLKLSPIILHEQPNRGNPLLSKLLREGKDIEFAVVLLTPDDLGAPATDRENAKPRARQNVIFEMGLFLGALGPERVCVLKKEGVEVPSDIAGVVYVPMDPGEGWKLALARELRQVWPEIDVGAILS